MPRIAHRLAALVAAFCLLCFFISTVLVELLGTPADVARVKALIVTPGLWIMLVAMAATGGSGMALGGSRRGRLVELKKRRMPFIAANGLLVLLPCALLLHHWAAAGAFDRRFHLVQALELLAGAINLLLIGLNLRDGLRLSGRLSRSSPQQQR